MRPTTLLSTILLCAGLTAQTPPGSERYGIGCRGAVLDATMPTIGTTMTVTPASVFQTKGWILGIGLYPTKVALGTGCTAWTFPFWHVAATGPLKFQVPDTAGMRFYLQAAVNIGPTWSLSNGVKITIGR